jgi:protein-tyrosine phosphatase
MCTANVCRSPMAEAILLGLLERRHIDVEVVSAGILVGGQPMDADALATVARDGPDMNVHRSQSVDTESIEAADLVLCMERHHVREIVVRAPNAWGYTFTLKELVRRGEAVGPRPPGISIETWLAEAAEGRTRRDLLGASDADDIADPIGRPLAVMEATADLLRDLCERLADLLFSG